MIRSHWLQIADAWNGIAIDNFLGGSTLEIQDCAVGPSAGTYGIRVVEGVTVNLTIASTSVVNYETGFSVLAFNGDVLGCSAVDCGTGFDLAGVLVCDGLTATGCSEGVKVDNNSSSAITMTGCQFSGNGIGMFLPAGNNTIHTISSSEFTANAEVGVDIRSPAVFDACSIHDNGTYDVIVGTNVQAVTTIEMHNCWWGETTTQEMIDEGTFSDIEAIFDWWDDNTKSLVDYEGFIDPTSAASSMEVTSWASVKARYR